MGLEEANRLFYIEDGLLRWKIDFGYKSKVGTVVGRLNYRGYRVYTFRGTPILVHRIMYSIYHQLEIPSGMQIDHVDRDRSNNSIDNLRLATHTENCWNKEAKHITHWVRRKILKSGKISEISYWKVFIRTNQKRVVKLFPYTYSGLRDAGRYRKKVLLEYRGTYACI